MLDLLRTIVEHGGLTVALIALASLVAFTVVIERCWRLLPLRGAFALARRSCREALLRAGPAEAIASLSAPGPMARVLRHGLLLHERGPEAVRGAALGAAQQEVAGIERGLGIIQLVSQIAPWLGLLGTVVGLMDVFSRSGSGAGGLTHATASAGISQALGCTVAGLAVAIAAYVAYQLLAGLSTRLIDELEGAAEELPSFLKGRG
jgi:biopolymer transport protein ExbB